MCQVIVEHLRGVQVWHARCRWLPQWNITLHQLCFAELSQQTCRSPAQLSDEAVRVWLQQPHLEAFRQSFITHHALHWFWMVTSYKKCDSAEPGIAERPPVLGEKPLLLLLYREKSRTVRGLLGLSSQWTTSDCKDMSNLNTMLGMGPLIFSRANIQVGCCADKACSAELGTRLDTFSCVPTAPCTPALWLLSKVECFVTPVCVPSWGKQRSNLTSPLGHQTV